jgi:hypothetical protein
MVQRAFCVEEIGEVASVAVLFASQEGSWLCAPSPVDGCRCRTRPAPISKPRLLTLQESCPVGLPTKQTENRRGLGVNAPIRSGNSPLQTALDLDRGTWMGGTREWRPRLPDYGRASGGNGN